MRLWCSRRAAAGFRATSGDIPPSNPDARRRSARSFGPLSRVPAPLDSVDRALLGVLAAALRTSVEGPSVWPGYRLAHETVLACRPGTWAALVHPPEPEPEGWDAYPDDWPPLSAPAVVRPEGVDGLVGQLVFDHEVPGGRAVAVPLYPEIPSDLGPPDRYLFAFLTHESFHQYQRRAFSDVDTPSEEAHPVLDAENHARAALEMLVLEEALSAVESGDTAALLGRTAEALAIHATRWDALDATSHAIERAKEVVEGTATYVETKSVPALADRCRSGPPDGVPRELCAASVDLTAGGWIVAAFDQRLEGNALSPPGRAPQPPLPGRRGPRPPPGRVRARLAGPRRAGGDDAEPPRPARRDVRAASRGPRASPSGGQGAARLEEPPRPEPGGRRDERRDRQRGTVAWRDGTVRIELRAP